MASQSILATLAAQMTANVATIDQFCTRPQTPHCSIKSPMKSMFSEEMPDDVKRARKALLEAAYQIQQIANTPSEYLEQEQVHVSDMPRRGGLLSRFQALHVVAVQTGMMST